MIAAAFSALFGASQTFDPLDPRDPVLARLFGGSGQTQAGVHIDEDVALSYAAFWRGVNLLCDTISKVPLRVIRQEPGGGFEPFRQHPAWSVVRYKHPEAELSSLTWRRTIMGHSLTYGNGYGHIFRDGAARPLEIVPLLPDRTRPVRIGGVLFYQTRIGGRTETLLPENVLHIAGLSWDGTCGYNTTEKARESLGVGLAARTFGARFFGQGANGSGLLMVPNGLEEEEEKRLRESFEKARAGLGNSHRLILLEEGTKFQQLTIPPEHAQFIATREFEILEIANWLGVPPHKLGHSARVSYNSLEQENQAFLDDSIEPRFCNWEDQLKKLLTNEEAADEVVRIEFQRDALRRVDQRTEIETMTTELNNGGLNLDEYRRIRNRPALPDGLGQKFRRPANIVLEGEDQPVRLGKPAGPPPLQQRGQGMAAIFARDAGQRLSRRIAAQADKAAKSGSQFCVWLDGMQAANLEVAAGMCGPLAAFLCCGESPEFASAIGSAWLAQHHAVYSQIAATHEESSLATAVSAAAGHLLREFCSPSLPPLPTAAPN